MQFIHNERIQRRTNYLETTYYSASQWYVGRDVHDPSKKVSVKSIDQPQSISLITRSVNGEAMPKQRWISLFILLFIYLFQAARPIYRTAKHNKSCTHAHTHTMHKRNLKESNTHTHIRRDKITLNWFYWLRARTNKSTDGATGPCLMSPLHCRGYQWVEPIHLSEDVSCVTLGHGRINR